ncbi:quinolinate synthase NadA [Zymobacter sp. IVIA_5232.4 C2]|uniref:quinolinate synthase NadA n=1 Tax=Zymobacter sp. IVIA_5232.4 C2 TaxID=3394855 RepID=UPI0039C18149
MIPTLARKVSISSPTPSSTCSLSQNEAPWLFDTQPYGPGASEHDHPLNDAPRQPLLPAEYRAATREELDQRIRRAKALLGERLLVLGHFYQRDDIVEHADFIGDSFQLAQATLQRPQAEYIVFCGVHFMAETADILSQAQQAVVLPHLGAGCSMADMADEASVEACWRQLSVHWPEQIDAAGCQPVVPVTYMNSSAALKAFCGRHRGIVCTSSNARQVLEWAFARGQRVLFFPDQHLGRNTAHAMGIDAAQCVVWDPLQPNGGLDADQLERARVLLWKGHCSVHQRFTVEQIDQARERYPQVRVIVHPECNRAVVEAADENGSTDYIRRAIEAAPAGSVFAIGTEINLVNRLARQHSEHTVFCLDPVVCPCSTMYRIHPAYLAWVLEGLLEGEVRNRISVGERVAQEARVALDRMLAARP